MTQSSIRYLVLFLTGRCNLRCRYCYASELAQHGAMPFNIAADALNLAVSSNRSFHVQFTGGEPLLEPKLMTRICKLVRENDASHTMGVQTNGTLLNDEIAGMLQRYQIEVGLSIDGVAEIHNQQRGRFGATINGLHVLANHDIPCRITAVVTMENVMHLDKLALMLAGFPNVRGIGLDLLVNKGSAAVNQVPHATPELMKKSAQALLAMLDIVNSRRSNPLQVRELNKNRRSSPILCHAAKGESMAVLPDGSVYPCSQTAGDPDFNCGTIHNVNWKRLRMSAQGDDCPSRTHYNQGTNQILHAALKVEPRETILKGIQNDRF